LGLRPVKKISSDGLVSRESQFSVYSISISFSSFYPPFSGNGRLRETDTISGKEIKGKKKEKEKNIKDEERTKIRDLSALKSR
jgi:hypothetical protein